MSENNNATNDRKPMAPADYLRWMNRALWILVVMFVLLVVFVGFYMMRKPPATPVSQPMPIAPPVATATYAKRANGNGKSVDLLRTCFEKVQAGCEKIVVIALTEAAPYSWRDRTGWHGIDVELAKVIARQLYGSEMNDERLEIRAANRTDDRLNLRSSVDADFGIGAITDDGETGPNSRRGKFQIEFTKSYAEDSYGVLFKRNEWRRSAPAEFCAADFSDPNSTLIELRGSTGTLAQYRKLCQRAGGPELLTPNTLSDSGKPTSIDEAVQRTASTPRAFFFSDSAVLSFQRERDPQQLLVVLRSSAPEKFKLGFVVRNDEGGWNALIDESLTKAKQRGELAPICAQSQRYFAPHGLRICNDPWN